MMEIIWSTVSIPQPRSHLLKLCCWKVEVRSFDDLWELCVQANTKIDHPAIHLKLIEQLAIQLPSRAIILDLTVAVEKSPEISELCTTTMPSRMRAAFLRKYFWWRILSSILLQSRSRRPPISGFLLTKPALLNFSGRMVAPIRMRRIVLSNGQRFRDSIIRCSLGYHGPTCLVS